MGAVGAAFGLDRLSIEDVLDVTLFPKIDEHDDYLFVVLHGVVTRSENRLATTELDLFVGRDFLVSVHLDRVLGVEFIADVCTGSAQLAGGGPARMAAALAEAGSRRYLPLELRAVAADPLVIGESQALRRDVVVLRRIIGPQRDVLRRLSATVSPIVDEAARRAFADVYDHLFRIAESLDGARLMLGALLETYRGAIAEGTNDVMKVLTVFSAILLPLSLIAGLWGMNFADIPGSTWRWGFVALLGATAVIAAGLWVYFVRRGFVGGPRLRDVPRAVGLGIAPPRAVGSVLGSGGDQGDDRAPDEDSSRARSGDPGGRLPG